jgi:hypothetical protein
LGDAEDERNKEKYELVQYLIASNLKNSSSNLAKNGWK